MRYYKLFFTVLILSLLMQACEKEGDLIVISGFTSSELSIDNVDIVLTQANIESLVLSLSWTESTLELSDKTMGVPQSLPSSVIEVSTSSDFDGVYEINPTTNPHVFTGAALNNLAKFLALEEGVVSPVYFRIRSILGKNIESTFSEVLQINLTPFKIDMSRAFILDADKNKTDFYLYSPDSDGEYSGFMNALGWYNWYLQEGDETIWGNVAESDKEFFISDDADDQWNLWFPEFGGCYFSTVNTNEKEWTATYIPDLIASGAVEGDFTFIRTELYWMLSFTTDADNAKFSVSGNTSTYNVETSTENSLAVPGNINFIPGSGESLTFSFTDDATEFEIPVSGEYTIKIFLADLNNLHYTIETGSVIIEDPISEYLYLPGIDDGISGSWTFDNYLTLINDMDSTFVGVAYVNSLYGYIMSLEVGEWDNVYKYGGTEGLLKFKGAVDIPAPLPGLYLIDADLKNLTYAHTEITDVGYSGLNDDWDIHSMNESGINGVYVSSLNIGQVSEWGGKILLNQNWDLAFGGSKGKLIYGEDGFTDDADIGVGAYDLIVDLCNSSYVFLSDEVYIVGLNDDWELSSVVLSKASPGIYEGKATIVSPSPWGMAIQLDQSWNRFFGGSFDSLSYLGDNITDDQALSAGTYDVIVDFLEMTCSFTLAD